jgi:hypothetical protein
MASTPEGRVKAAVKKVLDNKEKFGTMYQYWPVPAGYGSPTLDCIVCYRGLFIGIETKAPGKHPTPRQELTIADMVSAGAITLVIDTTETSRLERVLEQIRDRRPETQGADIRPVKGA